MKLATNFIAPAHTLALPLATAFTAIALALVGMLAWLIFDATSYRTERSELEQRLVQLQARAREAKLPADMPTPQEFAAMRQRVGAVNAMSVTRGRPTTQVLGEIEGLLPDPVWLTSLLHRPREGEVRLVAESGSVESLTAFLLRLEKDSRFAEVLLTRQAQTGAQQARAMQFEIKLKEIR